ncbi:MAG: sulfide/dihydroorotate dehydrogenase-like FAD/NAD-binding protein [Acidobacteriia bacterium]|nr:sulfide/dihydroorotate dehydrogenase-like FAD/NAD-binding protein [Terriglobia bacterium]
MHVIVGRKQLAPDVVQTEVEAPLVARKRKAGQFVMIRISEEGERIPLTIADSDPVRGTITLIVQAVGKSTKQLNQLQPGDTLVDVVGPLGKPTHIEPNANVVCIGGGIGAAVVYPILKAYKDSSSHVTSIIGARTKDLLILEQEIRARSEQTIVTTDDGSYGMHGFVTDALKKLMNNGKPIDLVIAIGPVPMMRAVCRVTQEAKIKTIVSLNPIMVDGTGMCGGCRVMVGGKMQFVCVDGPEFEGHEVDFDELTARLKSYVEFEKEAQARYENICGVHCGLES